MAEGQQDAVGRSDWERGVRSKIVDLVRSYGSLLAVITSMVATLPYHIRAVPGTGHEKPFALHIYGLFPWLLENPLNLVVALPGFLVLAHFIFVRPPRY